MMKRLNLMPSDLKVQSGFSGEHALVALTTSIFAYILISYPIISRKLEKKQIQLTQLQEASDKLQNDYNQLTKENVKVNSDEEKIKTFRKLLDNKSQWGNVFQELTLLAPSGVWFNRIKAENTNGVRGLLIEGRALSPVEISTLFSTLENSFFFRKVRLKTVEEVAEITPRQFSFEFIIEIPSNAKEAKNENS